MTDEKKINPAEDEMMNEETVESVSGGRLIGDFIDPIELERKENIAPNVLIPGVLIPRTKDKKVPDKLNPFNVLTGDSEGNTQSVC
jgi:hypothetical protein